MISRRVLPSWVIEGWYNRRRLRKHIRWGYLTPHETRLRFQQDQSLAA
ncbi:hypothetical protein ACWGI8_28175 [Streptomyces sp. NPDC054841]